MKKLILIAVVMISCTKGDIPVYKCHSPMMPDVTFIGYSQDDIDVVIQWRIKHLGDTLICECL